MGFLVPVDKATGKKKPVEQLSEPERVRMAEDIERDQTSNLQRGIKPDRNAIELGVRLIKGVKGREGYFDELIQQTSDKPGARAG